MHDKNAALMSNETFLKVVAAGCGVAGLWYVYSKLPSSQYASAQKTYMGSDHAVALLLENFDQVHDDISLFATKVFPRSPFPLADLFNTVASAHENTKAAIQKLDNAVWWSKEEQFGKACALLKGKLQERILVFEKLTELMRANATWQSQYSLYYQKCCNDELIQLAFDHDHHDGCCHNH